MKYIFYCAVISAFAVVAAYASCHLNGSSPKGCPQLQYVNGPSITPGAYDTCSLVNLSGDTIKFAGYVAQKYSSSIRKCNV